MTNGEKVKARSWWRGVVVWLLTLYAVASAIEVLAQLLGLDTNLETGGWQAWVIVAMELGVGWFAARRAETWYHGRGKS